MKENEIYKPEKEILTMADAELILHLYSCGSMSRKAKNIARQMKKSYNYTLMRLGKLTDLELIRKAKRGQEVFYTRPSMELAIQCLVIRDDILTSEAKKHIEEAQAAATKDRAEITRMLD